MFRAAVISIVLTLAVGPSASLLCAVWCHPEAASAGPCEHPDLTSAPSVTANDSCPDIVAGSTAFVRGDVLRGVFNPQAQQNAVVIPPFQLAPPPRHAALSREAGQAPPLEARPLVLALRI